MNTLYTVNSDKLLFLSTYGKIICFHSEINTLYVMHFYYFCPAQDVTDLLMTSFKIVMCKNIKIVFSSCIAIAIFMVRNQNYCKSYLGSSTVTTPLGWISTLFPQNLSLGWIEPWKTKCSLSAWKAEIGGWWLTCSHTTLWK